MLTIKIKSPKLKNLAKYILIISLLFFRLTTGSAQEADTAKLIILSNMVGETIDAAEKIKYRLFPFYSKEEFDSAQLFEQPDKTILLRTKFNDNTSREIKISMDDLNHYRRLINKHENIQTSEQPETGTISIITLQNNSVITGKILNSNENEIEIDTKDLGKITIAREKIKKIKEAEANSFKQGEYWFENPNPTRYFFGPSAFQLKKGEGYYQNTYLFLNNFNYGITDNISIGGGFDFISMFAAKNPMFFLTPKAGIKVHEKINIGGGALMAAVPSLGLKETFTGIVYGVGTYGTTDHNITFGSGLGFIDGEFAERPVFTLSGTTRISKGTALVTENWFIPIRQYNYNTTDQFGNYVISPAGYIYENVFSYGIRFFGEKVSVDLGFINHKEIVKTFVIGVPYVDFVVKF